MSGFNRHLISDFGSPLISEIGDRSRFQLMLDRIRRYSMQHPQNSDMREIVQDVTVALAKLN